MTPERRRKYRQGLCDAMALGLHRLTGLPLVKIVGFRRRCEEPAHAAVKAGEWWIDVDGLHQGVPTARLTWLRKPDRIAFRPSSVEEVTHLYTVSGVPESEIQTAIKDALEDSTLAPIIRRFRSGPQSRRSRRS